MQAEMTIRICKSCDKPLKFKEDGTQEGVYCCDEYYHEGECLAKSFEGTGTTWDEHYDKDGDCYFTEWEPEVLESDEDNRFNAILAKNILARDLRDNRDTRSVLNDLTQLETIEQFTGTSNQPSVRDIVEDEKGWL